jgi:hypothetical protein
VLEEVHLPADFEPPRRPEFDDVVAHAISLLLTSPGFPSRVTYRHP